MFVFFAEWSVLVIGRYTLSIAGGSAPVKHKAVVNLDDVFAEKLTLAGRGQLALDELRAGKLSHDWMEWCLVCFVQPDNLTDMAGRDACMILSTSRWIVIRPTNP